VPDAEPAEEADRSDEEQQRLNRQMTELLNELRVAMPGVQVLFAFLLAVPFQQRFRASTPSSATSTCSRSWRPRPATAFLVAPSAYHRSPSRSTRRSGIIQMGTRQFVCGSSPSRWR
jgi:hypothetical protein